MCISAMKSEAVQAAVLVSLVIDGKKALATMPSYTVVPATRDVERN